MSKKNKKTPPPLWQSLLITVAVILLVPLPLALIFSGIEWITHREKAPAEFIAGYVAGLVLLLVSLAWFKYQERRGKK